MNKAYLFYLRCEIRLHKKNLYFMSLYKFKAFLKMLRVEWREMEYTKKVELGYD